MTTDFSLRITFGFIYHATKQKADRSAHDVDDPLKALTQHEGERMADTVVKLHACNDNPSKLSLIWKRRGWLTAYARRNH